MRNIFLVALVLVPSLSVADKIAMKQGLWEMTGDMEMGGQKMASPRIEQCITEKDLDGTWFQQLPPGMDCKADQKVTASTVTWTLDCKQSGMTMKTAGKVNYTKTSFEGSATMKMNGQGMNQTGSVKMQGKYLGACKK